MGNLCGKQSSDDPFSQPGRALGSTPEQPSRAPVPAEVAAGNKKRVVGGPPRTLGGASGAGQGAAAAGDVADARRKAAEAAEARAKKATQGKASGKLSAQLAAQKKQTRTDALREASETALRERDLDASAEAMAHN